MLINTLISSHDEGVAFQTGVIDDIEMLINPAIWQLSCILYCEFNRKKG
jgi:hypothetical protein